MIEEKAPDGEGRAKLTALIADVLASKIPVADFCRQFETLYNFEVQDSELSKVDQSAFSKLFEKVVWYSPLAEERRKIPNYLGESDILDAVKRARDELGGAV